MDALVDVVSVAYRSGQDLECLNRDIPDMTGIPHTWSVWNNDGNPKTLTIAWNDLGQAGRAPYLVFLNTDIRVSPGWAAKLIEVFEGHPEAGAVLPHAVGQNWPTLLDSRQAPYPVHQTAPAPPREAMATLAQRTRDERGVYAFAGEGDRASFFAVMVRRSVWDSLKGFDERFRFYGQDHDFQRRLERLSLRTLRAEGCPVWHRAGGSTHEAAKRGELDLSSEMHHNGRVKGDLQAGRLRDWDLLSDVEREGIRRDPGYCRMPVFRR